MIGARSKPACRTVLAALLLALAAPPAPADRTKDPRAPRREPALDKPVPESVDDLRALQKQVKAVLAKVVPCTVGVVVGGASGSGVIVKDGYVLTAGHVSGEPGKSATVILPDGRRIKGKT